MITTIPFTGFYDSLHNSRFDDVIERAFQNDDGEVNQGLLDRVWCKLDISTGYQNYAKAYAKAFCEKFEIVGEFESMTSPREYNFTTDRIFIKLADSEIQRIFNECDKARLTEVCKAKFTSRDGFSSFYSPDWQTWGDVTEWDHNQCGALIQAFIDPDFDKWAEYYLCEDFSGFGLLDDWICENNPEFVRLANVAYYLRKRAERV